MLGNRLLLQQSIIREDVVSRMVEITCFCRVAIRSIVMSCPLKNKKSLTVCSNR